MIIRIIYEVQPVEEFVKVILRLSIFNFTKPQKTLKCAEFELLL